MAGGRAKTLGPYPDSEGKQLAGDFAVAWTPSRLAIELRLANGPPLSKGGIDLDLAEIISGALRESALALEACTKRRRVAGEGDLGQSMSELKDRRTSRDQVPAFFASCAWAAFGESLAAMGSLSQELAGCLPMDRLMKELWIASCAAGAEDLALAGRWRALSQSPAWELIDRIAKPGEGAESDWVVALGSVGAALARCPAAAAEGAELLGKWGGWQVMPPGNIWEMGRAIGACMAEEMGDASCVPEAFWISMPWKARIGACFGAQRGSALEAWMWSSLAEDAAAATGDLREEMGSCLTMTMWSLLDEERLGRLEAAFPNDCGRWIRAFAAEMSIETSHCLIFADALSASLQEEHGRWARELWASLNCMPGSMQLAEILAFHKNDPKSIWPKMFEILLAHREALSIEEVVGGMREGPVVGALRI